MYMKLLFWVSNLESILENINVEEFEQPLGVFVDLPEVNLLLKQ